MLTLIKKKLKLFLFIFLILAIGVKFLFFPQEKKQETAQVKKGILEEKLTISGNLEAEERVVLRFQTSGKLAWVGVKEGDYVKKYQAIASLDQREVKKRLEQELIDYLKVRWDFEEAKRETYKDKVLTDTIKRILEKNQFDLNRAVLDVEIQNLALEFSSLWTPIEGVVTRITTPYAGVFVSPTNSEIEIVNPKTIYFAGNADQTEVTKLVKNQEGLLVLDAYPEATLSGVIKDISLVPKSGETGIVYAVKFVFPHENSDYKYRIGMAGDLTFVINRKENALFAPAKFIKTEKGRKYVWLGKNGQKKKIFVETGIEAENLVEIISGINENDTLFFQ